MRWQTSWKDYPLYHIVHQSYPVINVYDLPESLNISIILAVVSQMSPQHQRTGGLHPTADLLYIVLELPECGELRKLIGKEELEESLAKKRFQQLANALISRPGFEQVCGSNNAEDLLWYPSYPGSRDSGRCLFSGDWEVHQQGRYLGARGDSVQAPIRS